MKVAIIYNSDNAVSYHRLILPYKNIDIECLFIDSRNKLEHRMLQGVKVLIWNRECPYDLDLIIQWRNIYNFKIIVDIDDYWHLPISHLFYKTHQYLKKTQHIIDAMRIADIVTCTHELLKEEISHFNKNVKVISNAINFDKDQFVSHREKQTNKLIYIASVTHYNDLKSISPTIQYLNNFPEMELIVGGYSDSYYKEWVKIENIVMSCKNSYFISEQALGKYMPMYDAGSISIAPLEDTKFSMMKSNLKILEAGCKNIPIICSNIHPYSFFKDVKGVYLCSSNREWKEVIKYLYQHPETAYQDGFELGEYVRKKFALKDINKLRLKILNELT